MSDAIEFKLDDGQSVIVMPVSTDGSSPVGWSDRLKGAEKTLREALEPITTAATEVVDSFQRTVRRPDEIEIEIGVTLDAKLGAAIASAGTNAHLDVTLRWHAADKVGSPSAGPDNNAVPQADS